MGHWVEGGLQREPFGLNPDCKPDVASYPIPIPQHHGGPATMDCFPSNREPKDLFLPLAIFPRVLRKVCDLVFAKKFRLSFLCFLSQK